VGTVRPFNWLVSSILKLNQILVTGFVELFLGKYVFIKINKNDV